MSKNAATKKPDFRVMDFFGFGKKRESNLNNFTSFEDLVTTVKQLFGGSVSTSRAAILGVPIVFACINRIAGTISSLPIKIYKRDSKGKTIEALSEHPLYYLIHTRPNMDITAADFRMALIANLLLKGNAFAKIGRDKSGKVRFLEVLPHDSFEMTVNPDSRKPAIYTITVEKTKLTLSGDQIIHLRGMTFNGYRGEDAKAIASQSIMLAQYLIKDATNFFKNGARPGLIIKSPEAITDQGMLERLKASLIAAYSGSDNAFKTLVLEQGMDVTFLPHDNENAKLVELRKLQNEEICRIFGVPPHKVGLLERSTNNNIEEQGIDYIRDAIRPICTKIEQEYSYKLLDEDERANTYIEHILDGEMRGNTTDRFAAYAVAITNGFMTVNEVRALENLNPLPGGDVAFMPLNLTKLGQEPETKGEPNANQK